MEDLNRMFSQAGLRFDQDFLNRVFFNSGNVVFRVYTYPAGNVRQTRQNIKIDSKNGTPLSQPAPKPNFIERWAARIIMKLNTFIIRKLFGIRYRLPGRPWMWWKIFKLARLKPGMAAKRFISVKWP